MSAETGGILVGLVPLRLAAPTRSAKAARSIAKEFDRVAHQAGEWQGLGAHATFWEMGGTVRGADENRLHVLAGQMAAAGEQLGLALSLAIEVSLWGEQRAKGEDAAHEEMAMRAMAESQSLFVIGGGHALANVAVRALALDRDLRAELSKQFKRKGSDPFAPFSDDRADWVSINKETADRLRPVAMASRSPDVVNLIDPVVNLAVDSRWIELVERRGEDFHRWRPQSHGIAGAGRTSPWKHDGSTRTLSIGTRTYDDARGLADLTATLAKDGMLLLTAAMASFGDAWPKASRRLGGPSFVLAAGEHEAQVHVRSLITGESVHFKMPLVATVQATWDQAYTELEEQARPGDTFRCADGTDLGSRLGETLAQFKAELICQGLDFEIRGPSGGA